MMAEESDSWSNHARASVRMDGDRVIKRQGTARSRYERERSQFGARVAAACGVFEVPEILGFDDGAGEIVFRFVPEAVPVKRYLTVNPKPALLERCGYALACIHTANTADFGAANVCWHGDYGMGNLLYAESGDQLTIVDWSNAHWSLEPPDRSQGPAALDLGIALLSLFHRMVIRSARIPSAERLGAAFLSGYALGRPAFRLAGEEPFLSLIVRRWRRYHLARWGILRTLAAAPSWARAWRFFRSAERGFPHR